MPILVLAALLLAYPVIKHLLRRHRRTRATMVDLDATVEEQEVRLINAFWKVYNWTVVPALKAYGAFKVFIICFMAYHSYQFMGSGMYKSFLVLTSAVSVFVYGLLMFYKAKITVWVHTDPATHIETEFSTQAKALRADPTGAETHTEERRESPFGLEDWLMWVFLPSTIFCALNFGVGVELEARQVMMIGIGWGAYAIAEFFVALAGGALLFMKFIATSESVLQIVMSTIGAYLPPAMVTKLEVFFRRPNIGNEEKYLPEVWNYFWRTLATFLAITVPCFFIPTSFRFMGMMVPSFFAVLIIVSVLLWIKAEFKGGEAAGYTFPKTWRERGFKTWMWFLVLFGTGLIIVVLLAATGYWDTVAAWPGQVMDAFNKHSFFGSKLGLALVAAICFVAAYGLIEFAKDSEIAWLKYLALLPAFIGAMTVGVAVWRLSTWDGNFDSTPATAPTTAPGAPKKVAPKSPSPSATDDDSGRTEVAGSAPKRNPHLDEHCRKFGCAPGTK